MASRRLLLITGMVIAFLAMAGVVYALMRPNRPSSADVVEIKRIVEAAFRADNDNQLEKNDGQASFFKEKIGRLYSAKGGTRARYQEPVETWERMRKQGFPPLVRYRIVSLKYMSITGNDREASVVVDIRCARVRKDSPEREILERWNVTLEKESDGVWRITSRDIEWPEGVP